MKKLIPILTVFLCVMSVACTTEEMIYDVYPIELVMDVCDKNGNSLLNPEAPGNVVGEDMTIEYKGEVYPIQWKTDHPERSRYYLAVFMGMWHHRKNRYEPALDQNVWVIRIGELPGDEKKEYTLPITFRGKTHTLYINHKWYGVNSRRNKTEITFDGKKVKAHEIKLVVE